MTYYTCQIWMELNANAELYANFTPHTRQTMMSQHGIVHLAS